MVLNNRTLYYTTESEYYKIETTLKYILAYFSRYYISYFLTGSTPHSFQNESLEHFNEKSI